MVKDSKKCKGNTFKGRECRRLTCHETGYCSFHFHQSKIKVSNLEDGKCGICLENAHKGDALQCGHLYHRNCVKKMLKAECPTCRTVLTQLPLDIRRKIERNAFIHACESNDMEDGEWLMNVVYNIIRAAMYNGTQTTISEGTFGHYDETTRSVFVYIPENEMY